MDIKSDLFRREQSNRTSASVLRAFMNGGEDNNSDKELLSRTESNASKINTMEVDIEALNSFKDHPFKIIDNEEMDHLVESIKQNGVIYPIICRPIVDGGFEIIAGHRRTHAAKIAGRTKIPAIIENLTDDEAIFKMVDSNIQRENILPSERAFAFKMKMDAMKRQGQKSSTGEKINTAKQIGEESGGLSDRTVHRYIKLTALIPEFLNFVDERKINKDTTAQSLACLSEEEQRTIFKFYEIHGILPSDKQAVMLKKLHEKGITEEDVAQILGTTPYNKKSKKITFKKSNFNKYFSEDKSDQEIEKIILDLLEKYYNPNN